MMNLRNVIALLRCWGMCCPRTGGLSLAEIRESARWPPGKTRPRRYLGQNWDRRNIRTRLADLRVWLGVDRRVRALPVQQQPCNRSRSRELRLQHREQFLDVLVRIPHMRGHTHGPTA